MFNILKQIKAMKVFIINGGQHFAHSGGKFNKTLTDWTIEYFKSKAGYAI